MGFGEKLIFWLIVIAIVRSLLSVKEKTQNHEEPNKAPANPADRHAMAKKIAWKLGEKAVEHWFKRRR